MDQNQKPSQKRKAQIQSNLSELRKKIPAQVNLIVVSKRFPIEDIQIAYDYGERDFAENRVEELLEKSIMANELGLSEIRWHFIGNLQSNKIKKILNCKNLEMIHSIDSLKLLATIAKNEHLIEKPIKYFLQINTSSELEKNGFTEDEKLEEAMAFKTEKLTFCGFMTMSKLRTDDFEKAAHECFKSLKESKDKWQKIVNYPIQLSMGMSADYKISLLYDTDYIRLGSCIFGSRK